MIRFSHIVRDRLCHSFTGAHSPNRSTLLLSTEIGRVSKDNWSFVLHSCRNLIRPLLVNGTTTLSLSVQKKAIRSVRVSNGSLRHVQSQSKLFACDVFLTSVDFLRSSFHLGRHHLVVVNVVSMFEIVSVKMHKPLTTVNSIILLIIYSPVRWLCFASTHILFTSKWAFDSLIWCIVDWREFSRETTAQKKEHRNALLLWDAKTFPRTHYIAKTWNKWNGTHRLAKAEVKWETTAPTEEKKSKFFSLHFFSYNLQLEWTFVLFLAVACYCLSKNCFDRAVPLKSANRRKEKENKSTNASLWFSPAALFMTVETQKKETI